MRSVPRAIPPISPISPISVAELACRLGDRSLVIWNVLTDDQFDGRMVAGSQRVPLDRVLKTARAAALASDTELVVYGSGPACPQAQLAAEKLAAAGFSRVRLLECGGAVERGARFAGERGFA